LIVSPIAFGLAGVSPPRSKRALRRILYGRVPRSATSLPAAAGCLLLRQPAAGPEGLFSNHKLVRLRTIVAGRAFFPPRCGD
jgi:hypothetical protein